MFRRVVVASSICVLVIAAAAAAQGTKTAPAKPADQAAKATTPSANPVVVIETSMGNITVELAQDKAPKTVANFLGYVKSNHYTGTIFHRVIPGFMIQGGGHTTDLAEKPTKAPVVNEGNNGLKNVRGAIAMARKPDPNSATAQFFICVADKPFLDYAGPANPGYAVFGKVLNGMDVVDKIVAAPRGPKGGHTDVPNQPIVIKSVKLK
jgi:cyclophilin family peptidyl-prolyl cis-trans isomerase